MKTFAKRSPQSFPSTNVVRDYQEHFERTLERPSLRLDPYPSLVWWIPGYVPPAQRDARNRIGYSRSAEVQRLREARLWGVKTGEVLSDDDPALEPRVVSITTWKTGRLYDDGNFRQACKALLDSLQPDALRNDSLAHCFDFYSQRLAKADNIPVGTLVVIHKVQDILPGVRLFSYGASRSHPRQ